MGRQQLFTENTLTVILPLLGKRDLRTFGNVVRLWTIVLAANLIGAFAQYFAYMVPILIGNIIGGSSIVAAIAHAEYIGGGEGEGA